LFSGFTFNSKHSSNFDVYVKTINRPLLPELRKREVLVPSKNGVYDFGGNTYENKLIELSCTVIKPKMPDLRQQARLISGWLKDKGILRFDDEPDKYYIGRVYSSVPLENVVGTGVFTLIFDVEPFAYSDTNTLEVTRTDDSPFFIFNNGNVEAPNEITITNLGVNTINGFKIKLIKTQ
jgi:predicted phage tail component-like protein